MPSSGGFWAKLPIVIAWCLAGCGGLLVILTITVFIPNLMQAKLLANRAACFSNLNSIGKGLAAYMAGNDDRMPLIKMAETDYNGASSTPTRANQTDADYSSGEWETTLGDQAMQNVWLMIAAGNVADRLFRCPSDPYWMRRDDIEDDAKKYGWHSPHNYSYGLHWPYATDATGNENPLPLVSGKLVGSTVIMADLNPGGAVGEDGRKPSNHSLSKPRKRSKNFGTGYLSFGGSAGWMPGNSSVRRGGSWFRQKYEDDLYINADGVAGGMPQSETDTSIALSGRE
jgi:hypothetical protein